MLFSRACEYAIQAVLYLAKHRDVAYVSIKEVAEQNNISFHFLGKVLQKLTQQGILKSFKGPNGGVALAKPAEEMTLLPVVEAIDGQNFSMTKCIVGLPECNCEKACPLHDEWKIIRDDICNMLLKKKLTELIQ